MISDAGKHLPQIPFPIQPIELGGLDPAIDRGGTLTAGTGTGEQVILLPPQCHTVQGALCGELSNSMVPLSQ